MLLQIVVFALLTLVIAGLTYWRCRAHPLPATGDSAGNLFLAGRSLRWYYIAGSLTLTNINTDTLIGWNGNQTLLVIWWELAGVVGLLLLAHGFLPLYYREGCATVTELLERRYGKGVLRAAVAGLFLLGNVCIFLPIMLYTSALFLQQVFGLNLPIMALAIPIAIAGAAYAIFGGLRAVAISDTLGGVLLFAMALLVVWFGLNAADWRFDQVPAERLAWFADESSVLPWSTLLTGMVLVQLYYWSTNQTITQRALAAPDLREAQRGCYAAAALRGTLVPLIVIVPGLCAYQLFGELGDATYGTLVRAVLPASLSGAFAAAMVAATMTSFNSTLNASAALYLYDFHLPYGPKNVSIARLGVTVTTLFAVLGLALVPAYIGAESIIQLIQQLIGLFSMPILAAFCTGLLFAPVNGRAVLVSLLLGSALYGVFTFAWSPLHFLHLMAITWLAAVAIALLANRWIFRQKARFAPFWQK